MTSTKYNKYEENNFINDPSVIIYERMIPYLHHYLRIQTKHSQRAIGFGEEYTLLWCFCWIQIHDKRELTTI